MLRTLTYFFFFFFNDTATTEIYTLSLHDALPILGSPGSDMLAAYGKVPDLLNFMDYPRQWVALRRLKHGALNVGADLLLIDRKSTRLNSSHLVISYAVFCLKKKKIYRACICNTDI